MQNLQAIEIKYLRPTNTRGARMQATAAAGRKLFPYDFEKTIQEQAKDVAAQYCKLKGWSYKTLHIGILKNGNSVAVMTR